MVHYLQESESKKFKCRYHCLTNCVPKSSPYCIAEALRNGSEGNVAEGLITCGANAHRINKIVPVRELLSELVDECRSYL